MFAIIQNQTLAWKEGESMSCIVWQDIFWMSQKEEYGICVPVWFCNCHVTCQTIKTFDYAK